MPVPHPVRHPLLHPGDTFPALEVTLVGGEVLHLPDALEGSYGVVLLNRGSWCPFCNAQLRGFQRSLADLGEVGASVVSLSADDEDATRAMVERHGISFPVGHSAVVDEVSALTGAYVDDDRAFLQATGFVLDSAGQVVLSAYSSGAIGRLTAEDTLGFLRHVSGSS